jgi:enterochelin esterase-like enzyme
MFDPFLAPTPGPYKHGPDSKRQEGVPRGTVTKHEWRSEIFPGTVRDYWIYVPAQYADLPDDKDACLMVFQDGAGYAREDTEVNTPVVFDNLVHQGRMPVTIGVYVHPGHFPPTAPDREPVDNRHFEYCTLSDHYTRFLLEEILPEVGKHYRLTEDPERRAICGASAGGICAWTVAWERPDSFRKVYSQIGGFNFIQDGQLSPYLIRKTPPKPIRVFLQTACNDADFDDGNLSLANLQMAAALEFMGYDYRFAYGDGGHSCLHGGVIMPEVLTWLWRD